MQVSSLINDMDEILIKHCIEKMKFVIK